MTDVTDDLDSSSVIGARSRPTDGASALSHLDTLRQDVADERQRSEDAGEDLVELEIPERAGWTIVCTTRIGYNQLAAWRKQSMNNQMPGGVHELKLAALVLAHTCRRITKDGEDIGEGGAVLTVRDGALKDALGAKDAVEAVITLFDNDFHVGTAANKVLAEAGMGDDIATIAERDAEGPTSR